jgi:hypothetical protein
MQFCFQQSVFSYIALRFRIVVWLQIPRNPMKKDEEILTKAEVAGRLTAWDSVLKQRASCDA